MPPRKRAESAPKAEEPVAPETDSQTACSTADDSARSDLQTVDRPCEECFPNGWPQQAFSVGCTHGTWIRDNS
ncbi:hypothetical protein [Streptomyces sp. NPDC020298]|uniref:hypothetical protein n=1 Tax=unclassified Streptomyces TaxID=2593676 RepID=UPI0033E2EC2D